MSCYRTLTCQSDIVCDVIWKLLRQTDGCVQSLVKSPLSIKIPISKCVIFTKPDNACVAYFDIRVLSYFSTFSILQAILTCIYFWPFKKTRQVMWLNTQNHYIFALLSFILKLSLLVGCSPEKGMDCVVFYCFTVTCYIAPVVPEHRLQHAGAVSHSIVRDDQCNANSFKLETVLQIEPWTVEVCWFNKLFCYQISYRCLQRH